MTTFCSRFALLHNSPWNHHPAMVFPLTHRATLRIGVYVNLHPQQLETRVRVHHYLLESLVPLRTAMFERYWRARDRETGDDA